MPRVAVSGKLRMVSRPGKLVEMKRELLELENLKENPLRQAALRIRIKHAEERERWKKKRRQDKRWREAKREEMEERKRKQPVKHTTQRRLKT